MHIDVRKDLKALYQAAAGRFVEVKVPAMRYLAFDGHGDPNTSPAYPSAVSALYATGHAVLAAFKKRTGSDFVVGPLEGLWSSPDPTAFTAREKDAWDWTMLVPLPAPVEEEDLQAGTYAAGRKKPDLPTCGVRVESLREGLCLRTLHVGSYDDETAILGRLHD